MGLPYWLKSITSPRLVNYKILPPDTPLGPIDVRPAQHPPPPASSWPPQEPRPPPKGKQERPQKSTSGRQPAAPEGRFSPSGEHPRTPRVKAMMPCLLRRGQTVGPRRRTSPARRGGGTPPIASAGGCPGAARLTGSLRRCASLCGRVVAPGLLLFEARAGGCASGKVRQVCCSVEGPQKTTRLTSPRAEAEGGRRSGRAFISPPPPPSLCPLAPPPRAAAASGPRGWRWLRRQR